MQIRVITTGGTIDKVYFETASVYKVGKPQAGLVFRESNITFDFTVEPVMQKDSLELTNADRALISERVKAAPGSLTIITHGTDTMALTAERIADISDKTTVFTGSMKPTRSRYSDAAFNPLAAAIGALQALAARRLHCYERTSFPRRQCEEKPRGQSIGPQALSITEDCKKTVGYERQATEKLALFSSSVRQH